MPIRIQRKRTKGWRMPEGAVYVGRPSKWGNPWPVGGWVRIGDSAMPCEIRTARDAATLFRLQAMGSATLQENARKELRGKDLACWCRVGSPCHADVLLELVNPSEAA